MINKARLRQLIDEFFSSSDLRILLFDLDKGVDYDDLGGTNKSEKIIEIITFFENRALLEELVDKFAELRPHLNWKEELAKDIDQENSHTENHVENEVVPDPITSENPTSDTKLSPSHPQEGVSVSSFQEKAGKEYSFFQQLLASWQGWLAILGILLIFSIVIVVLLNSTDPSPGVDHINTVAVANETSEAALANLLSANATANAIQGALKDINPESNTTPSPTELALLAELNKVRQQVTAAAVAQATAEDAVATLVPLETDYLDEYDGDFSFEAWPTEYQQINQNFNANPQFYSQFGLPGHEGTDIEAPEGSKVFAVAPGVVDFVNSANSSHNYGIYIRINHSDDFQTIYAQLSQADVIEGQEVEAGELIGLAGNTGNSFGAHLHFGLKRAGYLYGDWPFSIFDPTPFLLPLIESP